ncbi:MAG: hypothetical protein ACP5UB_06660 [Candidatus Sumerlaeaceae bacterium]
MRLGKALTLGCAGVALIGLTGCAGTASQAGPGLTRVFVPPPPLGKSNSTITVVPARASKKASAEKSWGKSETPGGQSQALPSPPSTTTALVGSPGGKSLYDLKGRTALQSTNSVARPSGARSAKTDGKKEVPIPVLYESVGPPSASPAKEEQPAQTPAEVEFDPRLAS